MGELHGRPDTPPEEPDKPASRAPDRARTPDDPPTDSNKDPRAVWRTIRASDHPAFAYPNVDVRYVTDGRPDLGPANIRPYRTSKERPEPESEPEQVDGPTHRPPDLLPPTGEKLMETDGPGDSVLNRLRKAALDKEALADGIDSVKEAGSTLDDAISKPQGPTYAEVHSRSGPSMYKTPDHGVEYGDAATSMLVAGILIGEGARLTFHKMREMRETRHARHR